MYNLNPSDLSDLWRPERQPIKPLCEPGPTYETCRAENLRQGTILVALMVAFIVVTGTWIWLVLSGRWELLRITHLNKDKVKQFLRR